MTETECVDDETTVIVNASTYSTNKVFHTRRDCYILDQLDKTQEKPRGVLFDHLRQCGHCIRLDAKAAEAEVANE